MSNFDSTVLSGSTGDAEQLESELESSLPVKRDISSSIVVQGPITAQVSIRSLTSITLAADEILDIQAYVNWSGTTAGNLLDFEIFWNGSAVNGCQVIVPTGGTGTSGQQGSSNLDWEVVGFSGTANLSLEAQVLSGGGSLYVLSRHIRYKIFKKRA